MKNIKHILILFLSLFIFSCNNDDDSQPVVAKEYFPTKITTSYPTYPSGNGETNILYDNQNRISKLVYINDPNTFTLDLTYSTANLVTSILVTKNTPTVNTVTNYIFSYTNNFVSQLIKSSPSGIESFDILYNAPTKTYTIDDGTTAPNYFTYNNDGNINEFVFDGLSLSLNHNGNKGIYNGIENSFPIFFTSLQAGFEGILSYSQFFSNKEMISIQFPSLLLQTTVARNSDGNISQIDYKDSVTNDVEFTSTVTYEQRTIN